MRRLKSGSGRDFYVPALLQPAHRHAATTRPKRIRMHDNDDSRTTTPTEAAPPPSQDEIATSPHASEAPLRDTQPPGADDREAERAMRTILPAAGTPRDLVRASDSLFAKAAKDIAEAARDIRESREERKRFELAQIASQEQILEAVLSADRTSQQNYETLRLAISSQEKHIQAHTKRLAEGDERFGRIEESIEALKVELIARMDGVFKEYVGRIQALEDELAAARATREAAATTTSPA